MKSFGFSKALPFAFTEHGAIQAANVLASSQAVEMGIYVVRALCGGYQGHSEFADGGGGAGGFGRRLLE
ncbi:hypothetical protein B9Z41_16985 [Limnohabitans sp. JirII-31]|nr:hypothetical protein B9Z41_16985 [Limnohabitans sp. JirII-31]